MYKFAIKFKNVCVLDKHKEKRVWLKLQLLGFWTSWLALKTIGTLSNFNDEGT
jgi:hypothetical protein